MRIHATLLSIAVLCGGLAACEDGPTQVYQVPPDGAASRWNDGHNRGVASDGGQGFNSISGSNNRQDICTGEQRHTRWAQMVTQPIQPPRHGAGLDLAGDDTWRGLTIEEAEQTNCQSTNDGDEFGDGTLVNQWGDNGEVWAQYSVSTRKILQLTFWNGYRGTVDFTSADGAHHYSIGIGSQAQMDGMPLTIDWVDPSGRATFDAIYRGLMHTFLPSLPQDPAGTTCQRTGHCIQGSFGDVAYFYIPPLGLAFWVDNQNAAQPTPSIMTRIDETPAKVMPFAFANPQLELDADGPTANAGNLGARTGMGQQCVLHLGMTYHDFDTLCVQVTDNAMVDATEHNKLWGGISHSTERFSFDVQGVDLNFSDRTLAPNQIIQDGDHPTDDDIASELTVDQSTLGNIQNDYNATTGRLDLHGTGAVLREYARIVRTTLLQDAGIADGDVSQCLYPNPLPADFDPATFAANLPAYCTGFEGMIFPLPPTGAGDVNDVGAAGAYAIVNGIALGLKPGHQQVAFCDDATGDLMTGYNFCNSGDTFPTSYAQVLRVFGRGRTANLPIEARDVRFFFKAWGQAFIKHLMAPTQADLSAVQLNYDDLFFDAIGAGQFEIMEYVDRRFASATLPPTDLVLIADVKNGIFNSYTFSREMYRGETALYTAVTEHQGDGVGQEDSALLTNLFGSPVLAGGWHDSSAGQSAYHCATTIDPDNCDRQLPPLDARGNLLLNEQGQPLLAPYQGAFTGTPFSLGSTHIQVMQTRPSIEEANVNIPLFTNPYDPTSAALPAMQIMVPWLPKQPGVGFPIALSGTLDRFVETYQLDFSGTTISANVDYDFAIDPSTHMPATDGSIQFLAVESTDFLGDVFLCQDGRTGDLLRARMYTPVAQILDWLNAHPGSSDACGIVIRYSPYDNYVDYITSLTNGVRLGVTQGGGFGRIVDATLFVPGQ